jgi:anti-sigma regulatory factor (Ser/Thr protein kinase)
LNTDQQPSIVLRRDASEAERARREVGRACQGLARDVVATAQLLASELFTNALDHGRGEITMRVTRLPGDLRVAIADRGSTTPQVRAATQQDIHGRGLMILESLAARWGVEQSPDGAGKTVWFALRTAE